MALLLPGLSLARRTRGRSGVLQPFEFRAPGLRPARRAGTQTPRSQTIRESAAVRSRARHRPIFACFDAYGGLKRAQMPQPRRDFTPSLIAPFVEFGLMVFHGTNEERQAGGARPLWQAGAAAEAEIGTCLPWGRGAAPGKQPKSEQGQWLLWGDRRRHRSGGGVS